MSTLADWVGAAAAALMPLVEVIRAHVSGRVCVDRQQKNAIREARALGLITMESAAGEVSHRLRTSCASSAVSGWHGCGSGRRHLGSKS